MSYSVMPKHNLYNTKSLFALKRVWDVYIYLYESTGCFSATPGYFLADRLNLHTKTQPRRATPVLMARHAPSR